MTQSEGQSNGVVNFLYVFNITEVMMELFGTEFSL
jgi:hypothetical protein